ncbi:MAG TPA: phenylalanine--tRNA ligase subunit beta [Capsulimonadaceae bacterium]|jgi:phenylalanyl-tRNA synthetase beta chain
MKVPLEWLGDFADIKDVSEDDLSRALTMAGLEVEEIDDIAETRVLVTKVTPNRGDWMSVAGTAREAAAALNIPFRQLIVPASTVGGDVASYASVDVRNTEWCPRYAARIIKNVKQGPSPEHIQQRLVAAGMRPIGNIVDITNYVMLEIGQPLHAFDYDKVPGGQIVVRAANEGETITTLDDVERSLTPNMLVIADRDRAIAIAGIMGGSTTEVTETTTTVLLESAHFDSGVIRRASKALGLTTEASYRFERYVDPALVTLAQDRACELFVKYAGATIVDGVIDSNPEAAKTWTVPLRPLRANGLLGWKLTDAEMTDALRRLDIHIVDAPTVNDTLTYTVPSFRPDVTREIDLIEEIGRMVGYETLPETLPSGRGTGGGDWPIAAFDSRLRAICIGQGLTEAHTHTLGAPSPFDDPDTDASRVRIRTALSAELSCLRQSLLPNLLAVTALNLRHRQPFVRVFEVGKTYRTDGPGKYAEPRRIAGVLTGDGADYVTVKGVVENILAALMIDGVSFTKSSLHGMHPGRCATILLGGRPVGSVAELDPDMVREHLDVPSSTGRIAVFEMASELLRELAVAGDLAEYVHPPKFPAVTRDLSLDYDIATAYGDISATAHEAGGDLLVSVNLVSVYTGDKVAAGRKSVAIRLVLRAADRTLTDADADGVLAAVQAALTAKVGASLRA